MRRHSYGAVLLLLVAGVMLSISQAHQTDKAISEEWWINLPSSPLRIARTPNGRLMTLSNHSSNRITQYQLGCVIKESDKVKVVCKMNRQKTDLLPADSVKGEVYFESLDSREKHKERCDKKNAKLAVVEVIFADGSVWKVDG